MILALEIFGGVQSAGLLLLPIAGSMMLAYGVLQIVIDLRSTDRRKIMDRLKGGKDKAANKSTVTDFRRGTIEATGFLAKRFMQFRFTAELQKTLEQANLRWTAPTVMVNVTAGACILLALLLLIGVQPIPAVGGAAALFVLPLLYIYRRKKARLKKLTEQLPDVFELLSQALRAGHSLASGMQLIAREMPDPAGTEYGRVFHEQNLGLKIEDALKNMAERVNILDVRFFVTAVLIQRQTGGDLAEVLDKLGAVIRDRIKLFGTVQALTAEGRLSGYVLLALPVLVFVVMTQINPGYAALLTDTDTGRMLLTVAIVMQLMGWAMIKKIVNIKV